MLFLMLLLCVRALVWGQGATVVGDNGQHNQASGYVPLDFWVYPAFDRLDALGYLPSAYVGMRPWTRSECVRLLDETGTLLDNDERAPREARQLYAALQKEFGEDRPGGFDHQFESAYVRYVGISGPPLRDGYHFAQTISNDYGRPFAQRSNFIAGISARATAGPLAVYVRGEFQQWSGTDLCQLHFKDRHRSHRRSGIALRCPLVLNPLCR